MSNNVLKKTIRGPDGQKVEVNMRAEVINCNDCRVEVTWPGEERYDKEKDVMVPVSEDAEEPLVSEVRCKEHSAKKYDGRIF